MTRTEALEYNGLTPPTWLLNKLNPSQPTTETPIGVCDTHFIQNIMLFSIHLCIIVIFLVVWAIKIMFKVYLKYDSHIFLILYNEDNCIHLPLRKLQKCPLSYTLKIDQPGVSECCGLFKPVIRLIWNNTHLHDTFSQEILVFPKVIRIPWTQRSTVADILKTPYKIDIVFQHKCYNYYPIPETAQCDFTHRTESEV